MNDSNTFGRYRVVDELGRGGMAIVYEAEDPMIGRKVALKVIQGAGQLPGMDADELQARFEREVRSAGVLAHPNIVHVYDVGTEEGSWWFAMELAAGDSLEKRLDSGEGLPLDQVLEWARCLADALDHSHRHGVVHRDVKPANILFTETGIPKISDFGIARVTDTDLTSDGKVLGTPAYMSPEQAAGKPVDGKSDQFSLGVVLYHALTGKKPFDGSTPTAVLLQIVKETPAPPSRVNPALPAAVDRVFDRVLAKDPDDRFSGCAEFVKGLAESVESMPATVQLGTDTAPTEVMDTGGDDTEVSGPATSPTAVQSTDGDAGPRSDDFFDDLSGQQRPADDGEATTGWRPSVVTVTAAALGLVVLTLGWFAFGGSAAPSADGPATLPGPAGSDSADSTDTAAATADDGEADSDEATADGASDDLPPADPGAAVSEIGDAPPGGVATPSGLADGEEETSGTPAASTVTPVGVEYEITSEPSGARVVLDNEEVGVTPVTTQLRPDRSHRLRVTADGHEPTSFGFSLDDLSESQRQSRTLFFPLESSIPPARVRVDADYAVRLEATPVQGGDPITADSGDGELSLEPGEYRLSLSAPEVFLQRTTTVRLESDQELVLPAPAVVSVTVAATPGNCQVQIDGRAVDVTPFTISLTEGEHEFRFEWPGLDESVTRTETISATTERVFATVPR